MSHDKAASLSHLIDMSNTNGSSKYAQVAINRDRLFVIWEEDDGGKFSHHDKLNSYLEFAIDVFFIPSLSQLSLHAWL